MMGQIATFMEFLHLSYNDVFRVIPYRNLLLMQKDKMREVTGETVKKISGMEMMERRNKNLK